MEGLETKEIKEIEQLQVQLAGCSVAALGGIKNPAKQGDYGWSLPIRMFLICGGSMKN